MSCKNLVQKLNASLAIQIALDWLTKQGEPVENLTPNNRLSRKITGWLTNFRILSNKTTTISFRCY